jgi:hypothetical protein
MTRIAWFHCFAGTAGDMTLAALVHAGADPAYIADTVAALGADGYALSFEPTMRSGLAATRALVVVDDGDHDHHHGDHEHEHEHHDHGHRHPRRRYAHIRSLIEQAALPERVAARAQATFRALADAEATMHGQPVDDVEFHEVGSLDAIIDIVGTCAALESLGIDRVVCSPITVGLGTVHAAHGELPNPAPAVTELLARYRAPARGIDSHKELATPTGVALMCALAEQFAPLPNMIIHHVGYGAGTAEIEGRPNVVQVVVGEADTQPEPPETLHWFEANVDDVTGEVIAHTISQLLAAGAVDAWATPIVMKKGRPAFTVHALCHPQSVAGVRTTLSNETGTLGVRGGVTQRWPQARHERSVTIDGHVVRVKVAAAAGSAGRLKVEFDDAAAAARALGVPVRVVIERAVAAAMATVDIDG